MIDLDDHVSPLNGTRDSSAALRRRKRNDGQGSSSGRRDGQRETSGDYLVVKNEGMIHLRSLLFFRADVDYAGAKRERSDLAPPAPVATNASAAAARVGGDDENAIADDIGRGLKDVVITLARCFASGFGYIFINYTAWFFAACVVACLAISYSLVDSTMNGKGWGVGLR